MARHRDVSGGRFRHRDVKGETDPAKIKAALDAVAAAEQADRESRVHGLPAARRDYQPGQGPVRGLVSGCLFTLAVGALVGLFCTALVVLAR